MAIIAELLIPGVTKRLGFFDDASVKEGFNEDELTLHILAFVSYICLRKVEIVSKLGRDPNGWEMIGGVGVGVVFALFNQSYYSTSEKNAFDVVFKPWIWSVLLGIGPTISTISAEWWSLFVKTAYLEDLAGWW